MVSKVISVWLFVFVVVVNGADDPKRDKRTVDVLLRGAADLFGYDVVRRITSPTLRQGASTPRPTFFPPPVAPQLPSGSYSRVILALGQQQQQQQQQLQRQLQQTFQVTNPLQPGPFAQQEAFSLEQERRPEQRTTILNIPQNGALTASAESFNFPRGNVLPVLHLNAPVAQVPLLSTLQAQPVIPVAPIAVQSASLTAQPVLAQQVQPIAAPLQQASPIVSIQQQQAPSAPQQFAPQQVAPQPAPQQVAPALIGPAASQQNAAPQGTPNQNGSPFGIPLQIVAIAPGQNFGQADPQNAPQSAAPQQNAQQNVPPQTQPQQNGSPPPQSPPPATPASGTNPQQTQTQLPTNGLSIVLDQGPTRWNLFSLPRQESVRRSLNLNLNWNRNVEAGGSPTQFQLVPVPLETTPTSVSQPQQAPPTQQPGQQTQAQQQQQLPIPSPTIENFDITTVPPNPNSAFNRYYNIPDNFQARTASQRQNDNNARFRDTVRQFWQSSPSNGANENSRRANLQEELRPRFEEYTLESNTEELNSPETEQIQEEQNEVVAPAEGNNNSEEYNDGNENKTRSRRFRINSDRFDEETRESSDAPKFRRKNKIRRIRKVKKSVDDSDESKLKVHQVYKREKKSLPDENKSDADVKNYYKKFTAPSSEQIN